jgi:hypothetical protein
VWNESAPKTLWETMTRCLVMATVSVLVAYTAWYLLTYSDFSNDDLSFLIIMKHSGFWQFVLTRAEVHYVPLHQLLTWLVYHAAPMNFALAVTVVIAFHVGTLIYLTRSFLLLGVGQAGGLFVCAYAGSSLIIFGLVWWAHAEHRAPYVFLDVCAIYHYLAWLRSGRKKHLWIAGIAFVTAFGFYEKSIFIPLHMLIIGYLSNEARFRTQLKSVVWPPMLFAIGSAAFILAYLEFFPGSVQTGLPQALRGDLEFVKVFLASALGLSVSLPLKAMLMIGIVMLGVSIRRGRGSWKILLAMVLVPFFDYMPIALSNRIEWLGMGIAHQYRFHYEELQLLVLLAGLWCLRVADAPISQLGRRAVWSVGFSLMLIYAGFNAMNVRESRHKAMSLLWVMNQSHIYLRHFRHGLAQVTKTAPVFEVDEVPRYLTIFGLTPDTRTLLPLFMQDVRFDSNASPRYRVSQAGFIELIDR